MHSHASIGGVESFHCAGDSERRNGRHSMIKKPQYGAASAIIGLTLCLTAPAPASADTTLNVGKANATSDAIIPVNVGDELGVFKKHGLTLKIQDFGGGSKMAQALAAGSIDIGDGAGTEMAFVAKGAPMMTI